VWTNTAVCSYVIYVGARAEAVWQALTDPEQSARYWAHRNVSEWMAGSDWEHLRIDGSEVADIAGTVVESTPPTHLVLTWANPAEGTAVAGADPPSARRERPAGPSRVSIDIEPYGEIVRLTVIHTELASDAERDAMVAGWAAVLSNLKSFLETGQSLPTAPWEMLPGFVRE
jgi:uncharacterized protein YndB with AHSA1/START domain